MGLDGGITAECKDCGYSFGVLVEGHETDPCPSCGSRLRLFRAEVANDGELFELLDVRRPWYRRLVQRRRRP